MPTKQTVLLLGGTGRTGRRTLQQLLGRGIGVRAIVRSVEKLPPDLLENPSLTVVAADLTSLADDELKRHLYGCTAVVSCLGHVISLKGIFGPPRDLVTRTASRICRGIEAPTPDTPVKFILMSSVSVHRAPGLDTRRGLFERAFVRIIRSLLPPAEDNQKAADYLITKIGADNAFVQWVAVRPDTLTEGGVTDYSLHENLVNSLFNPGKTNMANVAHFICELVTNQQTWTRWKSKLPVITNS